VDVDLTDFSESGKVESFGFGLNAWLQLPLLDWAHWLPLPLLVVCSVPADGWVN
jgi:hypothetical protein